MVYRTDIKPLKNRFQTADEIRRLVKRFHRDLDNILIIRGKKSVPVSSLSLQEFYDLVRVLPYKRDTEPVEIVGRPQWIFEHSAGGIDCKKKAVLMASYFELKKIPYRFIGSSRRPDKQIHHIFTQAKINGEWLNMDSTYKNYRISQSKTVTASEVL